MSQTRRAGGMSETQSHAQQAACWGSSQAGCRDRRTLSPSYVTDSPCRQRSSPSRTKLGSRADHRRQHPAANATPLSWARKPTGDSMNKRQHVNTLNNRQKPRDHDEDGALRPTPPAVAGGSGGPSSPPPPPAPPSSAPPFAVSSASYHPSGPSCRGRRQQRRRVWRARFYGARLRASQAPITAALSCTQAIATAHQSQAADGAVLHAAEEAPGVLSAWLVLQAAAVALPTKHDQGVQAQLKARSTVHHLAAAKQSLLQWEQPLQHCGRVSEVK